MVPGTHLTVMDGPQTEAEKHKLKNVPYMNMIGALRYAADATRPDICFTVSYLARFLSNPGSKHVEAVHHCFQYLKGTADYWLELGGKQELTLSGFCDTDGSTSEGSKAISGSIFKLGNSTINW